VIGRSYLITGGTGFLGSALTRRLVAAGARVRVLDNNSRGSVARLGDIEGQFEYHEGDIRDPKAVERACEASKWCATWRSLTGQNFFIRNRIWCSTSR
jgi:nucleoside-diphosphate-sugar epimerase